MSLAMLSPPTSMPTADFNTLPCQVRVGESHRASDGTERRAWGTRRPVEAVGGSAVAREPEGMMPEARRRPCDAVALSSPDGRHALSARPRGTIDNDAAMPVLARRSLVNKCALRPLASVDERGPAPYAGISGHAHRLGGRCNCDGSRVRTLCFAS